ncbi:MAG: choice-of-anchor Q domain-containing protein [Anaerolineales bacterium]
MPNRNHVIVVLAGFGLIVGLSARRALAAPAAVVFPVTSVRDVVDDNPGDGACHTSPASPAAGACTLRAAIMEADKTSGAGANILIPAGIFTLTIPADLTDTVNTGDLNLTTPAVGNPPISLQGAGAASTIIDGNGLDRVVHIETGRTAALSGLTLRGGFLVDDAGGGLYNEGSASLYRVTVRDNDADITAGQGGGVQNSGSMTITESTIGPNNTAYYCGGLCVTGYTFVERSTIFGNHAEAGGGIYVDSGHSLFLINTTISLNTSAGNGGGLQNSGTVNAYNSSIVFNGADSGNVSAGTGGGIYAGGLGTVNIRNTLLAGNNKGNVAYDDCQGTIHTFGNNLFTSASPCTIVQEDGGSTGVLNSVFLLGPLADNGGPTRTHALLAGSNAIDRADFTFGCTDYAGQPIATDQRGLARSLGVRCDVGALESLPPAAFLPYISR